MAGFVAILVLLVAALWLLITQRLDEVERQARADQQAVQRAELRSAIEELTGRSSHAVAELLAWDEVRQQLADPVYYAYWHESRAMATWRTPDWIRNVELYSATGQPLQKGVRAPGSEIDLSIPFPRVRLARGVAEFIDAGQLTGPDGAAIGWVVVQAPVIDALRSLRRFDYIDADSLRVVLAPDVSLAVAELAANTQFVPRAHTQGRDVTHVVVRSIIEIGAAVALAGVIFALLLRWFVVLPARRLSSQIDALNLGGSTEDMLHRSAELPLAELEKVRRSMLDYHARLDRAQRDLAGANVELREMIYRDELTICHNRRAFEEDYLELLDGRNDRFSIVQCMLFDCDRFKSFNDTYGHDVGDALLRALANAIDAALDQRGRLYRLGGDEFITLLFDLDGPQTLRIAQQCLEAVRALDFVSQGVFEPVRLSVGIAAAPAGDRDALSQLRARADIAMFAAKRPGRPPVCEYSHELESSGGSHLVASDIGTAIYDAIADPAHIEMEYQPVLQLDDSRIHYHEALARLNHAGRRYRPDHFMPVIAARRLEVDFDRAVVARVSSDLRAGALPDGVGVGINISGPGLLDDQVEAMLIELVGQMRRPMLVEITESVLIPQRDVAARSLERLREAGWRVALDDFGTGYSSLGYLADMPVDIVKFDSSLVRQLGSENRQRWIVQQLVDIVGGCGYRTVAEGVETRELLEMVREHRFHAAQGFFVDGVAAHGRAASVPYRAAG